MKFARKPNSTVGKIINACVCLLDIQIIFSFSHFISLPQLSFNMMLKLTGVSIELMSDIDQILFIERSIRGGLSFICQRYARRHVTQKRTVGLEYIDGEH